MKLRRSMLSVLCVLLFVPSGLLADGNTPAVRPKPLPFEPAEELVYEGEFSKLLLRGIQIAEFRFTATRAPAAHAPDTNLVFKSDATAKGWFRKLFGLDFHFQMESLVEPGAFNILRTTKRDEQGDRVRLSETTFDREAKLITWVERNPQDPQSRHVSTKPLADAAHDFISALYFLRTQPLVPGQTLTLALSDSGEVFHIPVRVVGRRQMKTVLGKVQTLQLDVAVFGAQRLIQRNGRMSLWLTDDARRIPVRASLDTDVGRLDIKLKRVGSPPGK